MKRALLGLLLVLGAAAAHFGLIFAGVYRRHPVEWWAVALAGAVLALLAFKKAGPAGRVVAAAAVVLAGVFGLSTTVLTRIPHPPLALAGTQLAPFELIADTGTAIPFPDPGASHRATLLVLFRGAG